MHGRVTDVHRRTADRAQGTGHRGTGRQDAPQKRQKNGGADWEKIGDGWQKNRFGSRQPRVNPWGTQTL